MSIREKVEKKNKKSFQSIKRRLTIVEKTMMVYLALASFPLALASSYFIITTESPFESGIFPMLIGAWVFIALITASVELALNNISLYKGIIKSTIISFLLSITANFSIMCIYFIWGKYATNCVIFATISSLYYVALLTAVRILLYILNKANKKVALLIGPKEDCISIARKLIKVNRKQFRVKYMFYEENLDYEAIETRFERCNTIIILNTLNFKDKQKFLLYFNSTINKDVFLCTSYFDIVLEGNNTANINDILSYEQKPLTIDLVEAALKRTFDIIVSFLIFILSLPIWLVVPLIIKLQDGGPVFYKQVRLTKGMKEFKILKFRSMRVDAEKNGAQLATSNDNRVTKFGKFIRATRIDEIPQILNVLKGDMSLVGPRPERPEFVEGFLKENELYKYRFNVKAGVTGLQQVSTTYHTTYDDKLRYDLYYIANYTVIHDIQIMFMTIKTVLSKSMAEGVDTEDLSFEDFLKKEEIEIVNPEENFLHLRYHKKQKNKK